MNKEIVDKIINIQTGKELDYARVETLKDNAMLKVKPELWETWDFEKNNELGLDIWKMTKGSEKKVWWNCLKCQSDYYTIIGNGCGYCSGKLINHTNSLFNTAPHLEKEWDYEKNTDISPHEIGRSSHKLVWWICSKCNSSYDSTPNNRSNNKNCPYCAGRRVNSTNSLASLYPHLLSEWHPFKNGDLTPHDFTSGSKEIIWWICPKCNSDYEMNIIQRKNNISCPYCRGMRVNYTNSLAALMPDISKEWHQVLNSNLTPHDVTCGSAKKAWWICDLGHEWEAVVGNRTRGDSCPYCTGKRILIGFNDMWTTNSKLAEQLLNPEDGYKYTDGSNKSLDWRCLNCGEINKNKKVAWVKSRSLSCTNCSDGISFPEKFMNNTLNYFNIVFQRQKTFNWSEGKLYDFYLEYNGQKIIIETHGGQHYFESYRKGARNLIEEQANDKYKYDMAMSNGIDKYIVIDCRYSELEWIKDNILNSELASIFNLSNINWSEIEMESRKSLHLKILDLWNNGNHLDSIIEEIPLSEYTIKKILRRFSKIGKCKY